MVRVQCKLKFKVLEPKDVDSNIRKQLFLTTLYETVFPHLLIWVSQKNILKTIIK